MDLFTLRSAAMPPKLMPACFAHTRTFSLAANAIAEYLFLYSNKILLRSFMALHRARLSRADELEMVP